MMGLFLLVCLVDLLGIKDTFKYMPSGVDDLAWANVTLKEIHVTPSGPAFKVNESPAIFLATLALPPASLNELIKIGDNVSINIKKEDADHLQEIRASTVYGLRLQDGRQLFDDSTQIEKYQKFLHMLFLKMSVVPIGYFLMVIYGSALRHKIGALLKRAGILSD